jgi:hypothetical protein
MIDKNTMQLEIYSWMGLSLGAIHFYAELHNSEGHSFGRLQHVLSENNVIKNNSKLRQMYSDSFYELYKVTVGEFGDGFDTKEEAIEEAIRQWSLLYPNSTLLVDYNNNKLIYAKRQ